MKQEVQAIQEAISEFTRWQLVVLGALIVLGGLYIWQMNISATRGFLMHDLERDIHSLSIENERAQLEVARLQSVESVSNRVQMLGLTKVETIDYIQTGDSTFALR